MLTQDEKITEEIAKVIADHRRFAIVSRVAGVAIAGCVFIWFNSLWGLLAPVIVHLYVEQRRKWSQHHVEALLLAGAHASRDRAIQR